MRFIATKMRKQKEHRFFYSQNKGQTKTNKDQTKAKKCPESRPKKKAPPSKRERGKLCFFVFGAGEGQRIRECVCRLGLYRGKGVGVDIERGGGLRVPQGCGYGTHIGAGGNQQRGVEMPKTMYA